MKIRTLLLVILLLGVTTLFSAPFQNVKKILKQPDGTELHCFASGDEFYIRLHDADGYTIVQARNGYFVYATSDARGNVVATDHIAGKTDPKALGLKPGIAISQEDYHRRREAMKMENRDSRSDENLNHGVYNNIVVFIKFKGDSDLSTTKTEIDSMFNYNGYYDISMNNYFKKATYNQLSMVSYCYPQPEGNKIIAYEDIYPRNYYQPYNETTNPEGYTNQAEREFPLLKRAIEFVADQVPDTLNIDRDNDGFIDNVIFVVKGNVGDWAELLWPHMWSMYGEEAYINGKRVGTFNFQLETSSYFSVSTLCHEMSHSLGFPDLYHYNSGYDHLSPSGPWDLMCGNASPPQHSATYMKYKYGTWIDEIPEITEYGTYTIEANSWEGGRRNCYKIPSTNPKQFYFIEYRNKNNFFEKGLPNSGLLIYRIDTRYHGCADYNGTNTFDEVYIFRPGGTSTKDGRINEAAYSLDAGKTVFNYDTDPYPFLNRDQEDLEFNICNISARGDQMSFTYCPVDTENVPQNLWVNVDANNAKVELRWDANELADSYNIYRNDSLIANVTENSFDDVYNDDLLGYQHYYVTSVSDDDESYRSNEKSVILGGYSEYVVNMQTTGENGWQGGEIVASFDNGMEDLYFTIYSGQEKEMNFIAPEGTKVTLSWVSGWDDAECSFTMTNKNNVIYTSSDLQEGLLFEFISAGEKSCIAPQNLKAELSGSSVTLNWGSMVETESYTVMRNDVVIADNIRTNSYIDSDIPNSGTYNYCVKSVMSDCESMPSNMANISIMKFDFDKPVLKVETAINTAMLSWSSPAASEGALRYCDDEYVISEGSSSHNWGIRIPAEKLGLFNGTDISAVEIYDACDAKYTFKIYNGDNAANNNLIYTEEFETQNTQKFVKFNLMENVPFDNSKDLWITVKASGGGKPIPCGNYCDDPNSNLIKTGSTWKSAIEYGMNYSWLLRAYTSASEDMCDNITYNIYRDDKMIASDLNSLAYTDKNINGDVRYKVEAMYNDATISVSDEIQVSIINIEIEDGIFPNPTKDFIYVKADDIINVKVINAVGAVVFDQDTNAQMISIDMRNFESGTYIIQAITTTEVITKKIVYVL